jgi:transposase-like protein
MMAERGVLVDHATLHRWALKVLPTLAKLFRRHKHGVGSSWRVDETYVRVGGEWRYLYRAVDKLDQTVDFLRTAIATSSLRRGASSSAPSISATCPQPGGR